MTVILILEGNTPDMLRAGKSDAVPFVVTLMALEPGITLRLANPYARPVAADLLDGADGVVFSGSGTSWSTDAPEAAPQRAAMETVFATGVPVWGSCNGMQLVASVLGGAVGASPNGDERGIARDIELTEAGRAHPMMAGKPDRFDCPSAHRDEIQRLPDGAVLIAGNAHSPVQALVYERGGVDFWGVQYHPECSAADVAGWVRPRGPAQVALARDLQRAGTDPDAAARLGTTCAQLALPARARELANWLAHVNRRSSA